MITPAQCRAAPYHRMKGYKLCPECGQPVLKKGQPRKHLDDYRHARGCPNSEKCSDDNPSTV
jgi:hypothetical protein